MHASMEQKTSNGRLSLCVLVHLWWCGARFGGGGHYALAQGSHHTHTRARTYTNTRHTHIMHTSKAPFERHKSTNTHASHGTPTHTHTHTHTHTPALWRIRPRNVFGRGEILEHPIQERGVVCAANPHIVGGHVINHGACAENAVEVGRFLARVVLCEKERKRERACTSCL